jgi:moderate conductance mechanosensitive channel
LKSLLFSMVTIEKSVESVQNKAEDIINNPARNLWQPIVDSLLVPLGQILIIILLTYIALRYVGRLIDRLLSISRFQEKRGKTLARLIKSAARYAIYFISVITILDKLGVQIAPILAGAGIVGLAIGFGAQNLVKDVITGFFLIFDNQMEVGDFVQINNNIQGTVEEIGLRITKIREFNQRLHYLSNGEIIQVTNYNRDQMRPLVTVTVPYESDQNKVQETLEDVCQDIGQRFAPYLIEHPSVFGVTNIKFDGVEYTIMALCTPEEYWLIEREMRKSVVHHFNERKLEFQYPRSILTAPSQAAAYMAARSGENKIQG